MAVNASLVVTLYTKDHNEALEERISDVLLSNVGTHALKISSVSAAFTKIVIHFPKTVVIQNVPVLFEQMNLGDIEILVSYYAGIADGNDYDAYEYVSKAQLNYEKNVSGKFIQLPND